MSLSLAAAFGQARALWRAERALLLPIAGAFFFVPMLGVVLLLASSGFPGESDPDQLRAAAEAFYAANLVPILLANATTAFGTFAVLNLFLQGAGRTLGEVLTTTLRGFVPFLAMDLFAGMLFGLGFSLFILPGLYLFARTWLAAPAFAAVPQAGPIEAFRQGWRRSRGFAWVTLLGIAAAALLPGLVLFTIATGIVAGLAALLGPDVMLVIGYLVTALVASGVWTLLALLRLAAYRLTEAQAPRQGM